MSTHNTPEDDDEHRGYIHIHQLPKGSPASLGLPSPTGSIPPPSLSARVPQHLSYATALTKGRRLLDIVLSGSTAPSQFTSAAQLKDWGYTTTQATVFPLNYTDTWALLKLVVPDCTLDAKIVTSVHITPTTHNNIPSPATNAWFVNTIDLTNGILIAGSNHGPRFTTRHRALGEGERYPRLMHWSDIAYLQILSQSNVDTIGHRMPLGAVLPRLEAVKGLKYVIRSGIENIDTNIVVHEIIQRYNGGACSYDTAGQRFDAGCPHCSHKIPWPGMTFEMGSEEMLALLGTPNGCGVAWLLAQHGEFVGKTIGRVRLWSDLKKHPLTPNLLFYMEDAEVADGEVLEGFSGDIGKLGI